MKFYGILRVYRHAGDGTPEITEIFAEYFEAKSIQSAKAHLTKIANGQPLFSWVQPWDNATREYTGKDLRWEPWSSPPATYKQDNGVEVAFSTRLSERVSGETGDREGYKYGKSVEYRVDIAVHWRKDRSRKK